MGAPISRTRGNKLRVLGMLRYYAGQATALHGETIENSLPGDIFSYTLKEPVGVVGAIIPWNGPLAASDLEDRPGHRHRLHRDPQAGRRSAVDVAAARLNWCWKPAFRPASSTWCRAMARPRARHWLRIPDVDKVAFTGSHVTGQSIVRASAGNLKRVSLELGGKSPDIVFADADLDAAVPGAAMAVFANSGQICSAGTRLFVEQQVYDEFVGRVAEFGKKLQVGNGLDPNTQIGPLVSEQQLERVSGYLAIGQKEGAQGAGRRCAADRGRAVEGLLRAADGVRQRSRRHADRAGGNLRSGDFGDLRSRIPTS